MKKAVLRELLAQREKKEEKPIEKPKTKGKIKEDANTNSDK